MIGSKREISFNILNLERRTDRKFVMVGNLQTQSVSFDHITFHKAPDGLDYKTSEEMCAAAVQDGYPIFEGLAGYGRGDIGYFWGTLKILESIRDSDQYKYGYYNQDDRLLTMHLRELYFILRDLIHQIGNTFLFLQLTWGPFRGEIREEIPALPDSGVMQGALGKGDSGLIMSKAGADSLITEFMKNPIIFENLIAEKYRGIAGVYSMGEDFQGTRPVDPKCFGCSNYKDDQDRIKINEDDWA